MSTAIYAVNYICSVTLKKIHQISESLAHKSIFALQMFRLLSDTEMKVTMKTLGLLRNLLSDNKQHIDHITGLFFFTNRHCELK